MVIRNLTLAGIKRRDKSSSLPIGIRIKYINYFGVHSLECKFIAKNTTLQVKS